MFHKVGKHVKGLKLEELNVLGEMKSWSAMVGGMDIAGTAYCRVLYTALRSLDLKIWKVFSKGVASSELCVLKITLPCREENTGTNRNRLASGYAVAQMGDDNGLD